MRRFLLILIGIVFLTGCNGQSQNKYEEIMKDYAIKFYNDHQKGQEGLTNPTISIEQLKEAVEVVGDDFDLTKLEKCTDESYVELIIDETTKDVKDIKYYLECK